MSHNSFKRAATLFIAGIVIITETGTAFARQKTSGKASSYDEAYYVTTDYYGNITNGSIVKSYTLNGINEIRDKGHYDKITNLSDGKAPSVENGEYVFRFDDGDIPEHFYYECSTIEPYARLPWDVSISYRLNGVTVDAEELPGQKGIIEIDIDLVPNEHADEYSRNNYTLETTALFNKDDINSLEAKGAQVQLLGNLRTVLFAALPGEEQHVNIKVGTDCFSFDGLTFLLVPATLGQLCELTKLAEDKDKLEENYHKLSRRLDDTIDMIDDIGDDMGRTAGDFDKVASDAGRLAGTINPVSSDLETVKLMLSDSIDATDPLLRSMVSLKVDMHNLGDVISSMQGDLSDVNQRVKYLNAVRADLEDASDELVDIENDVTSIDLEKDAPDAYKLYGAYLQNFGSSGLSFSQALPYMLTPTVKSQVIEAIRPQVRSNVSAQVKAATKQSLISAGYPEDIAESQAQTYINSPEGIALIDTQTANYINTNPECIQLIETKTKEIVDPLVDTYSSQETQIAHLYNLYKASPTDASYDELAIINDQLTSIVEGISAPEMLLDDMSTLIGDVKIYRNLIDDLDDLGNVTDQAIVQKGQEILDEIAIIDSVINVYRPSAEQLVLDAAAAAKELTNTASDTGDMLDNLSDGLKNASDHISGQESLHILKDDVTDIIEDTWHDYTGDKNRLLLMDPDARPVSLTGAANPEPQSVQVIIRTQEIKESKDNKKGIEGVDAEKSRSGKDSGNKADSGNVFTRIGDMFADIWHTITGIFTRRAK